MLQALRRVVLAAALASGSAAAQLPSFEQVRAAYHPSDALLLDRNGEPLADIRFDLTRRRFDWVPLAQFSPALREALIAAEDHRFYEHEGVDWRAFVGSLWHNLLHDNKRGGSTLTMQLAGLLDPAIAIPAAPGARRSVGQKWDQGLAAQELEAHWSKAQILEAYLNLAPFRGDLEGVHAASAVLFGKSPAALDRPEALLITALLPSPNGRAERTARRACARAKKMGVGNLCPRLYELAPRLDTPRNRPRFTLAPHLARRVLHAGGERVTTTLDAATQQAASSGLRDALQGAAQRVSSAAVLVLDVNDASVRAWVGGLDPLSPDAVTTVRSVQSALWLPFSAANLIERRLVTGASLLPNSREGESPWRSMRVALQQPESGSQAAMLALAEPPAERLRQAGLELPKDSAASPELTLLQAAQAFRPFVAGGNWQAARWQADSTAAVARRLWRNDTAYIIADWLADPTQKGAASELQRPDGGWQAVWRMSDPTRDIAIAMHAGERYLIAVQVAGSGSGAEQPARLAARAIAAIQHHLGNPPSRAPRTPSGVVLGVVAFDPPVEPARREWFLRGTEVSLSVAPGRDSTLAHKIVTPEGTSTGALLRSGEALVLESAPATPDARWWADDELIGEGATILWAPPAGHYRLELRSPEGVVWDRREFTLSYPDDDTTREHAPGGGASQSEPRAPVRAPR
ncbi:transglycosylase domain-containing protein [Niveibacterium sp.]|uniref:transglycosylase domain-containing protein n=1 Tax=Niveibacterium sp. TaxID=2017444 RepID=UPI0035B05D2E